MRTTIFSIIISLACWLSAGAQTQNTETRQVLKDGTVVINTTKIGASIDGYMGPTPVEISLKEGKISDIKALPNDESEGYFERATAIFKKFLGLTVKEALDKRVDAISGATFSSASLIRNIRAGLKQEAAIN